MPDDTAAPDAPPPAPFQPLDPAIYRKLVYLKQLVTLAIASTDCSIKIAAVVDGTLDLDAPEGNPVAGALDATRQQATAEFVLATDAKRMLEELLSGSLKIVLA